MNPARLPAGLCVYGMTYQIGLTWAGTERARANSLTAAELVTLTSASNLAHLELPPAVLPDPPYAEFRGLAEQDGVGLILAGSVLDSETTEQELRQAAAIGAPTLRCTLSRVLCGERARQPGGWSARLARISQILSELLPLAEKLGVTIAMENHQDATSAELVALCEQFQSSHLGVTLDCGNPLAVMEEPVAFAEAVAPYLRHVHLKDYRIHPTDQGFRLVRCALGAGAIDFPSLLAIFGDLPQPISLSIEMAALEARHIPFLDAAWWETFPDRDARDLLPVMELIWRQRLDPALSWMTPYELGAAGEEVEALEREELNSSVRYLSELLRPAGAAAGEARCRS